MPTKRRPLELDDYLDIARRNKAWILGPAFAALVAAVVLAFLWPDTYVSVATIRVVPPQVPENLVPANVTPDLQAHVSSLAQLVLNRQTLADVVKTNGLYQKELASRPVDDVIQRMRVNDLKVTPLDQSLNQFQNQQPYPAFEIRFAYRNRFVAQKVAADLVARFLKENIRESSQRTASTTQFLRDQWVQAQNKLDGLEQRISVFRARNMGRLPEEQQSNVQQMTALESQRLNLNMSMNRVNQEKLLNENQLRIYREQLASLKDPAGQQAVVQQKNERLAEKDREVAQFEDSLEAARQRYKETHPDVQRLVALLASARKQRQEIASQEEAAKPAAAARTPSPQFVREQRELTALVERTQGLMQAKDLEMDDYHKQSAQLDATVQKYQSRLESVPLGIKEYDELIRDRDLAKKDYEELDRRLNTSAMATALETRQAGERLEQLDPPTLPQSPVQPKRAIIIAVGTALGLVAGLCLAGVREMKSTALQSLKDVHAFTELPVLTAVPLLENNLVIRRRKRLGWLAWSAVSIAGAFVMSGSVVYYYASKL